MTFPSEVAERALLDSGRCCCLCHKFCSSKIELHHIEAKADGGEDTYDNCIPLCFDCHAEVRAYDPKHPKGRKFTTSELKGHRDRWYEKVRSNQGIVTSPDYLAIDRELLVKIREILPSTSEVIELMRTQDFYGTFPRENLKALHKFIQYCKTPEFEFLDADLESLRGELESHITGFLYLIGLHTFPLKTLPEFNRIAIPDDEFYEYAARKAKDDDHYDELIQQQQDKAEKTGQRLNSLAEKIYRTHYELMRLGRRKLAV